MAHALEPSIQQRIIDLVHARVECIRSGDRARIDATYSRFCLDGRTESTRHDYDWYMHLIETGFDTALRKIEISPHGEGASLPFAGLVAYYWPPQYRVVITTVTDRQTLWLVGFEDDGPKVVLPGFNGRVADSVALGTIRPWKEEPNAAADAQTATVVTFHPDDFTGRLSRCIAHELDFWWSMLQFETLRAIALDCAPWGPSLNLGLLTTQESFSEAECGKWALGDWRLYDFTGTYCGPWPAARELIQFMHQYYEGQTTTDTDRERAERVDVLCRCCAKALLSEEVAAALQRFHLTDDFEAGAFDSDRPDTNYCKLI
jgi:hypothetical protein